ncbi:dihydrofolate reductase family protein [Streptomyces sp. BE147]|uniref:dihydrofolate reductase family protein n=1 Tax=Streptomyces sp. BE147 TaxID=3002524 RepID=UPI002E76E1C7|nr:dihydrofolate reductase family protein [Streptomyces sp. BE147]MEE1736582.1 dihydrofolate reductase family protein [Streptomyces sp. BE147]
MNSSPKYIVSSTLTGVDEWKNSHLNTGNDIVGPIRDLKSQPGDSINAGGSITLVQWLMRNGLLDELHLQVNPVVGTGRTLAGGEKIPLAPAASHTFANGVIEAHYTLQAD